MRSKRRAGAARGFLLADVVIGLTLLGVLLAALALTARQGHLASQRLAGQRDAIALAEHALGALQTGQPPPRQPDGRLSVRRADGGDAPPHLAWATVRVQHDGQAIELTGLVPAGALEQEAQP